MSSPTNPLPGSKHSLSLRPLTDVIHAMLRDLYGASVDEYPGMPTFRMIAWH